MPPRDKTPGVNAPNLPENAGVGLQDYSAAMPGVTLRNLDEEAAVKDKAPGRAGFKLADYKLRVKRFLLSGFAEQELMLESLLDACIHSETTRIYLVDRKESFNKEGEMIVVLTYLEPKDAPYEGVVFETPKKDEEPGEGWQL